MASSTDDKFSSLLGCIGTLKLIAVPSLKEAHIQFFQTYFKIGHFHLLKSFVS